MTATTRSRIATGNKNSACGAPRPRSATTPKVKVLSFAAPPLRAGGGRVADVAELVSKLKSEAKVL